MCGSSQFYQRGSNSTLTFFLSWGGGGVKISLKACHHRLSRETPLIWRFTGRVDDSPILNAALVFQRIQTSTARKSYIFVIFRGGGGGSGPLSPLWITWCSDRSSCLLSHCHVLSYLESEKWLLCILSAVWLFLFCLFWMMPLHLHVNQKSDYDDDDDVFCHRYTFNHISWSKNAKKSVTFNVKIWIFLIYFWIDVQICW